MLTFTALGHLLSNNISRQKAAEKEKSVDRIVDSKQELRRRHANNVRDVLVVLRVHKQHKVERVAKNNPEHGQSTQT